MRNKSNIYFRYFTYIKPIAKFPIVKTYGSTIFTILVMIIFILFAIKPTVETILILQKKLEDSNQILIKLQEKGEKLSLGRENYENLNPSIETKIQAAIPNTAEFNNVIQILEGTAARYEASISALQIQPHTLEVKEENKVGIISEISFIFNVEGAYQNLISILQDLKTSSRLISTDNITLTKVSDEGGVIMSISGKVWYIR